MFGKRVVDDLYVHLSALSHLPHAAHRLQIEQALGWFQSQTSAQPNVAKLNLRSGRLSLLSYPNFDTEPFPTLQTSWSFAPNRCSVPQVRHYSESLNPPILHRKELLVAADHPQHAQWVELTKVAEDLGLFDEPATIGFKLNWERLIESKGYALERGTLCPLGNDVSSDRGGAVLGDSTVQRHLTALSRSSLSAPVQLVLRHGVLNLGDSVFDYGCGRGDDIAGLNALGYAASGWDPHYAPTHQLAVASVVNLGFVLNVIEDSAERVEALCNAFKLARRVLVVAVMLHNSATTGAPLHDGVLTSRGTFQKYFSQSEFKDYISDVLHEEVFMVGPGVALVFADKAAEQQFAAGRLRQNDMAPRLVLTRRRTARRDCRHLTARAEGETLPPHLQQLLDNLWRTALDLGRVPHEDEIEDADVLSDAIGSLQKAWGLVARHYDQSLLAAAAALRADDLRLYMATLHFCKRRSYAQLEPRLQRDIKAFFGDHRTARAAGLQLLQDAAEPEKLLSACKDAAAKGLGWMDGEHSLQLQVSLVPRLPVLLRAYVTCGLILWDAISEAQLAKIHIASGKLTLLEYDDFDSSPLPMLRRRVKINVRKLDYDVFDYDGLVFPQSPLYHKSRYMHEDSPGYAEQLAFDEALQASGVVGDSAVGPAPDELKRALEGHRLMVRGMALVASESIPDLDAPCGQNFTYRKLIECGETQKRLGSPNRPQEPASYNALHQLATQLLDPIVDYFGAIVLTFGFCSLQLSRSIHTGIAPKLDQHAACERDRTGQPICSRGGAACDFLVADEDMRDVAHWIQDNLPFDRLYFYGSDRPLHLSYAPSRAGQAYEMVTAPTGRRMPRPFKPMG